MRGLSPFFLPALATWRAAVGRCDAPSGLSEPEILRPSKTEKTLRKIAKTWSNFLVFTFLEGNALKH